MFFVYILFSEKLKKFYVGQTDDVSKRILEHNANENPNWTLKGKPWEIKLVIHCKNRQTALRVERFIKKQKSVKFLLALVNNSDLVNDILKKHET